MWRFSAKTGEENGNGSKEGEEETPSTTTPADEIDEVVNEQEAKYWKTVNDNPTDFTSWTYLLQFVEHEVCNSPNCLGNKLNGVKQPSFLFRVHLGNLFVKKKRADTLVVSILFDV